MFSENLKKEVLLQLGHNAPESLKTKAAVEIAKLMEKQSSNILDESFSQRGALDWLKRQRAVNRKGSYRYLWQAGMKDVYTLELCSEFFLLNANEFIENPKCPVQTPCYLSIIPVYALCFSKLFQAFCTCSTPNCLSEKLFCFVLHRNKKV